MQGMAQQVLTVREILSGKLITLKREEAVLKVEHLGTCHPTYHERT